MTLEALNEAIEKFIIKRQEAHDNDLEQKRINIQLNKLYNLKYLMLEQAFRC